MKYNKIFGTLVVALTLALLAAALPATPALAAGEDIDLDPERGKIGQRIDITGEDFFASDTVERAVNIIFSKDDPGSYIHYTNDTYEIVKVKLLKSDGTFSTYFDVPDELNDGSPDVDVSDGDYYVFVTYYYPPLIPGDAPYLHTTVLETVEFTVVSGELTLDDDEGVVGTEVEITGEGFDEEEDIEVKYDDDDIDIESGDDETDDDGEFTCTIIIPASTTGDHTITVSGEDSGLEATAEFTVEEEITITPESGAAGATITVSGTGFGDEVAVTITFDDDEVTTTPTSVTTNSKGGFTATFTALPRGPDSYHVEAEDADGTSDKVRFTIATALSLSPDSGYAGDEITVSGTGFQLKTSVIITFYNENVETVDTDFYGSFRTSFTVPDLAAGSYKVTAKDGVNTKEADFDIGLSVSISQTTSVTSPGYVGMELTIEGFGFKPNATVTIVYTTEPVVLKTVATDAKGYFSATFNIPSSSGGAHTITATDNTNTKSFTFVMESTPPSAVYLQLPLNGSKLKEWKFDWCGDIIDLSKEVTDDSLPITYTLQIAANAVFSEGSIVLEKTGLILSEYTITKAERLESVSKETPYYWRVTAIDAASNKTNSGTGSFYVGSSGIPPAVTYTLIGIGALLLGVLGFWLGRKSAYY